MHRAWFFGGIAFASATAVIAACVGDSPDVESANDGGGSTSSGGSSGTGSSGNGSSGTTSSSGGSSGTDATTDAGLDARAPCDAAIPEHPASKIACDGSTNDPCSGKCCYASGNPQCITLGAGCGSLSFVCDKASDCAVGSICCLTSSAPTAACPAFAANGSRSYCTDAGTCTAGETELCVANQKCKNDAPCTALTVQPGATTSRRDVGGCLE